MTELLSSFTNAFFDDQDTSLYGVVITWTKFMFFDQMHFKY